MPSAPTLHRTTILGWRENDHAPRPRHRDANPSRRREFRYRHFLSRSAGPGHRPRPAAGRHATPADTARGRVDGGRRQISARSGRPRQHGVDAGAAYPVRRSRRDRGVARATPLHPGARPARARLGIGRPPERHRRSHERRRERRS
ncbi:unnamed protein product [Rhizophagus irregularis]|uniref:Uncharacterized protein n=1 Tax=Rhizophagus irregularis TaxID=588596 RepID=A0A915ZUX7_9GLOM|nr:unnamed protein product [Rhizophagus irregularis]